MSSQEKTATIQTTLPELIGRLLVPIIEPKYTRELIDLALATADADGAQILALVVSTSASEENAETFEQVSAIVKTYQDEGQPVQLIAGSAGSISRGVLDAAREHRADLILFGGRDIIGRATRPDTVRLRTVVENVLPAAPCHVVMYRLGPAQSLQRLVVPVIDGEQPRPAAQLAIRIGQNLGKPVEAITARTGRTSNWDARGRVESALADIPGAESVKRTVIEAEDAVSGLLSRVNDDDLIVTHLVDRSEWERWLRTDVATAVSKRWQGALLLIFTKSAPLTRREKVRRWLSPTLTQLEQNEIERESEESASTSLDYLVLILVSAILAAFGLMLNSNAVIIGAMLVAPLMSPLIAFAVGMTLGRLNLVGRATITLLQGIAAALLISLFIGWLSPSTIVTAEMAARGNPSILDMGVALASGFIGAYATARKHIPSALAGVAIAAALMPPLTTVGLGLALDELALASGAALLFVTNIISIILAAWATFFWLGMRPSKKVDAQKTRRTSAILVIIFVFVLAALLAQNASTIFSATIEKTLRNSFQQSELVSYEVRQETPLKVLATIRMPAGLLPDSSEIINAQNDLEEALNEPVDLSVIIQPVVDAAVAQTNVEVEALIAQILDEQLTDMTVLGFVFEIGNPTHVLAVVRTDLESGSEELNNQTVAAEQSIAQELGLPVALSIITVESYDSSGGVDATDEVLSEIIEDTLVDALTCCEILSFSFQVGNPFLVTVSVTTDMDPASDEFLALVQNTENDLSMALGWPVKLTVIITQPTPTPTATEIPILPSATPTVEPTEVLPTAEPPTPEPPTSEPATPEPTAEPPTPEPTEAPPTPEPTAEPTGELPTIEPTAEPPTATVPAPTP